MEDGLLFKIQPRILVFYILAVPAVITHFVIIKLVKAPPHSRRRTVRICAEIALILLVEMAVFGFLITPEHLSFRDYADIFVYWLLPRVGVITIIAAPFYFFSDFCPQCYRHRATHTTVVSSKFKEVVDKGDRFAYIYVETYCKKCDLCDYMSSPSTREIAKTG